MEEKQQTSWELIVILAGVIILVVAAIVAVLWGTNIGTSTVKLELVENFTFNGFDMYVYTLKYCATDNLCTYPSNSKFVCTAKIKENATCILLENQLVCEGGVVCYSMKDKFRPVVIS